MAEAAIISSLKLECKNAVNNLRNIKKSVTVSVMFKDKFEASKTTDFN